MHAFLSEHLEHTALSQRPHPGKPKLQHVGFFSLFPLFSHYVVFPAHLIPCGKVNYLCYTEVCISCLDLCECWMCIFKLFLYISTWMAHKHIHLRFKATKTELAFFFFQYVHPWGSQKIRILKWLAIPFSNILVPWCEELTHWKRPWCWEKLKARGEGGTRGWDVWMASLTQWTWVWANSGRWWRTGKPGMLQFNGLQRVRHNLLTEQQQQQSFLWIFLILFLWFLGANIVLCRGQGFGSLKW